MHLYIHLKSTIFNICLLTIFNMRIYLILQLLFTTIVILILQLLFLFWYFDIVQLLWHNLYC